MSGTLKIRVHEESAAKGAGGGDPLEAIKVFDDSSKSQHKLTLTVIAELATTFAVLIYIIPWLFWIRSML
uniref:Transmembrane protein n=1 Tax=Ascaris lumbricoides TaxID=6252 RepID=A0A0M3HP91_ASCLU